MIGFSYAVKKSISKSAEIAKSQNSEYINIDHLILAFYFFGYLDQYGVLKSLVPDYLSEIEKLQNQKDKDNEGTPQNEFLKRAEKTLKRSYLYAKELKASEIKPHHVLISCLEQEDGEMASFLLSNNISWQQLYLEFKIKQKKTLVARIKSFFK